MFTVAIVVGTFCPGFRARFFFARLRFLFLFRFFAALLSDDVEEEDVEEGEEPPLAIITAAVRNTVFLSSFTFEFFATMIWSSTAL